MGQQTWCLASVGYVQVMPVVYCGLFPTDAEQFEPLREALGRLQLNDAALQFEPEVSTHPYSPLCTSCNCLCVYLLAQRIADQLQSQFGPGWHPYLLHVELCCLS